MHKSQKPDLASSTSKAIASYAKKTTASQQAARKALVKLGTHTKSGRLAKAYR